MITTSWGGKRVFPDWLVLCNCIGHQQIDGVTWSFQGRCQHVQLHAKQLWNWRIRHKSETVCLQIKCFMFCLATRSCQEASESVWLRPKLSEKWVMGGTKQTFIASEVFPEFRHHWSSHPDSHTEVILHCWLLLTYLAVWQQLQALTPEAHY